jgi:hypothetical protein
MTEKSSQIIRAQNIEAEWNSAYFDFSFRIEGAAEKVYKFNTPVS